MCFHSQLLKIFLKILVVKPGFFYSYCFKIPLIIKYWAIM
jgi:hypothetical protein